MLYMSSGAARAKQIVKSKHFRAKMSLVARRDISRDPQPWLSQCQRLCYPDKKSEEWRTKAERKESLSSEVGSGWGGAPYYVTLETSTAKAPPYCPSAPHSDPWRKTGKVRLGKSLFYKMESFLSHPTKMSSRTMGKKEQVLTSRSRMYLTEPTSHRKNPAGPIFKATLTQLMMKELPAITLKLMLLSGCPHSTAPTGTNGAKALPLKIHFSVLTKSLCLSLVSVHSRGHHGL